jgi:hypothetical protein
MYDYSKRKVSKSTTFWFSLLAIILNPIAWVIDYILKKDMLRYAIENNLSLSEVEQFIVNIPLGTIATLAVSAISFYTIKRGADKVSGNLQKTEAESDLPSL